MAMDILAANVAGNSMRAYITTMRIREKPELLATVRWYRCTPGAKPFPGPHCFGSTVWERDHLTFPSMGLGELTFHGKHDRGVAPLGVCGCDTPTPLAWFLKGVPAGVTGPYPNGRCPSKGDPFDLIFGLEVDWVGPPPAPPESFVIDLGLSLETPVGEVFAVELGLAANGDGELIAGTESIGGSSCEDASPYLVGETLSFDGTQYFSYWWKFDGTAGIYHLALSTGDYPAAAHVLAGTCGGLAEVVLYSHPPNTGSNFETFVDGPYYLWVLGYAGGVPWSVTIGAGPG